MIRTCPFRWVSLLLLAAMLPLADRPVPAAETTPPVLGWTHTYRGPAGGADLPAALGVDECGRTWVAGSSQGTGTGYDMLLLSYTPGGTLPVIRKYDGPAHQTDSAADVAFDADGNVYVAGVSVGEGGDVVLVKYHSSGEEEWAVRYDGGGQESARALTVDSEGSIYVVGTATGALGSEALLLKYNSAGSLLWEERYHGPNQRLDTGLGVGLDARDDSPYMLVWSYSTAGNYDYATLHYGKNGGLEWERRFDGEQHHQDVPRKLEAHPDGGVIVTGSSRTASFRTFWVTLRYDRQGALLWRRDFTAGADDEAFPTDLAVDRFGAVAIAGVTTEGANVYYTTARYDAAGNLEWNRREPSPPATPAYYQPLVRVDPAGQVYTGMLLDRSGRKELGVVAYDAAGSERWRRSYGEFGGTLGGITAMEVDGGGSVYLTGAGVSHAGNQDLLALKFDAAFPRSEVELYDGSPHRLTTVTLPAEEVDYSFLGSEFWPAVARGISRVAADGVTLLVVRVPLPEGTSGTVHLTVGDSGSFYDPGSLWSLNAMTLYDRSANGGERDRTAAGPREIEVPVQRIQGRNWAFALYRAPRDFTYSAQDSQGERMVDLRACVPGRLGDGFDSEVTARITVVRPLVLLVHGTFSSPDTWWSFPLFRESRNDLSRFQYPGTKPYFVSRLSFAHVKGAAGPALDSARELLPQFAQTIRKWADQQELAATQADVVTHSYGGVVTRLAAQLQRDGPGQGPPELNFRSRDDRGHGPVHKLITIGATHRGSAIANHVAAANRDSFGLIARMGGQVGLALDQGALRDQFVTRGAAALLTRPTPFPGHAILGSGLYEYTLGPERSLFQLLHWYDDDDGPYRGAGPSFSYLAPDNYPGIKRLTNYVFNMDYAVDSAPGELAPNYDLTVSSRSAVGGMSGSAYSDRTQLGVQAGRLSHMQETSSAQVSTRVEFLLGQTTVGSYFTPFPAFSPILSTAEHRLEMLASPGDLLARPAGVGFQGTDGPVITTDAVDGKVMVGQTLRVALSWPGKTAAEALLLWPTRDGTRSARVGGKALALDVPVEAVSSGRFSLAASVRASDGAVSEALLELTLLDTTSYTALSVVPEALTLDTAYPAPLTVYGQQKNGEWREITRSSATQVVSQNPNVAVVTPDVSVRSVGVGATTIRVTVAGAGGVDVPVTVTTAPPAVPGAPTGLTASASTPTQVQLGWNDGSNNEDGFEIERRVGSAGDFALIAVAGAGTITFTDNGVTALTRYEYRVRAYNAGGNSDYSNVAGADVPASAGGKLVVAKSLSFGVVRLGKTAERKLLLRNTDPRNALTVNVGAVTGAGFVLPQGGVAVIPKRGRLQVILRFAPPQKGKAQGSLSLRSSDPRKAQVTVKLIATGR